MGLILNWTTPAPAGKWTADRTLWLTAQDAVVEDGDAAAAFLLVRKGGSISLEMAKKYGLVAEPVTPTEGGTMKTEAPETKAVKGPPENKAVTAKETKKAGEKGPQVLPGAKDFYPIGDDGE